MTAGIPEARDGRRKRRGPVRLRRWAAGIGIVVVCLLAAGIWRLTYGPVAVPLLSAYLAGQLDQFDLPLDTQWEDAAIHWPFMAPWLDVRFSDFRASDVFAAEGVGVRLPLADLLRGRASVSGVVVHAPTLELVQGEDYGFRLGDGAALGSGSPLAALASGAGIVVLDGTVTLDLLHAAPVRIVDVELSVTGVDGRITLQGAGAASLPGHPAVPLELAARLLPEGPAFTAELAFAEVEPAVLAGLMAVDAPFDLLQVPLSGTVAVAGPLEAAVVTMRGTGGAGQLQVPGEPADAGPPAWPVSAVQVQLRYAVDGRVLDLEELTVTGLEGDLRMAGRFQDLPTGPAEIRGRFAGSMPVQHAAGWVGATLDRPADAWVRERVKAGTLTDVTVTAIFPDGLSGASRVEANCVVRDAAVNWEEGEPPLRLAVVELALAGPELTVTSATASAGAATLEDFRVHSADLFTEGGEATLTARLSGESGALLQLAGLGRGPPPAPLLQGPLRDADLRVLIPFAHDQEEEVTLDAGFRDIRVDPSALPAGYAGFDLRSLAGTLAYGPGGIDVRFAGELGDTVRVDDAVLRAPGLEAPSYQLTATLSGPFADLAALVAGATGETDLPSGIVALDGTARIRAAARIPRDADAVLVVQRLDGEFEVPSFAAEALGSGPWARYMFRDVTGMLALDGETFSASGQAGLADSTVWFTWQAPRPGVPGEQVLSVRGALGAEARTALGAQFAGVEGPVDLAVNALRSPETESWMLDAEAGLAAAEVAIAELDWTKPRRAPLHARVRGVLADGEPLQFRLEGQGANVHGRLWIVDGQLDRVAFTQLGIGEHRLAGTVAHTPEGHLGAVLDGEQVDLRSFLSSDAGMSSPSAPLQLRVDARRARTMAPAVAGPLALTLETDTLGLKELHLALGLPDGESMELQGARNEDALELVLTGTEARSVADAFGLGVGADGGKVRVEAVRQDDRITGTVSVGEFQMVDAPVFLQLLQTVTVLGLLEQIAGGGGVAFSRFDAEFTLADGVLDIRNGVAQGLTLGVTVEGAIDTRNQVLQLRGALLPAYALNQLLSRVPVIDRIITGADSTGVFVADYAVTGPAADPDIAVSPLQFLVPGILRDVLRGLGGAGASPESPGE